MKKASKLENLLRNIDNKQGLGLTIGNFDGVHLGHQKLLGDFVEDCKNYNLQSLVLTFDPHPKKIINPRDPYASRLFPLADLEQQMEKCGIDYLWIQNFNTEISQMSPEDFISMFLQSLPIKYLMVGHDFRFGNERKGKIDDLLIWCEKKKVPLKVFSPFEIDGHRVSSSLIKNYLIEGDLENVNKYLGRRYSVFGKVVHGHNRGEGIGFPTANLDHPVALKSGVYATKLKFQEKEYISITNVGLRPTVNQNLDLWNKNIETHVPGENLFLYDKEIEVTFYKFIRDEIKFSSLDALKTQIATDIQNLKRAFN
jgi:riboflavin kinase / FMN adenylyltransferase